MQKLSFICSINILCLRGEMQASGWLLLASLVRLPHDLIVGFVHSQYHIIQWLLKLVSCSVKLYLTLTQQIF